MQTLPKNLEKLLSENGRSVREALRELRQDDNKQQVSVPLRGGGEVVIKHLRSDKSA